MEFEWDEDKRLANLAKHGFDFERARMIFDGRPVFQAPSPYVEEHRFLTTAILDEVYVTAVWTLRQGAIRFISVRRARDAEKRSYRSLHGAGDR